MRNHVIPLNRWNIVVPSPLILPPMKKKEKDPLGCSNPILSSSATRSFRSLVRRRRSVRANSGGPTSRSAAVAGQGGGRRRQPGKRWRAGKRAGGGDWASISGRASDGGGRAGGWYVSNVSIIFDAPCLFLHHLACVSLHFVAFLCDFRN
jgi:hypothetical protein